jgi:hypothetical protein
MPRSIDARSARQSIAAVEEESGGTEVELMRRNAKKRGTGGEMEL